MILMLFALITLACFWWFRYRHAAQPFLHRGDRVLMTGGITETMRVKSYDARTDTVILELEADFNKEQGK